MRRHGTITADLLDSASCAPSGDQSLMAATCLESLSIAGSQHAHRATSNGPRKHSRHSKSEVSPKGAAKARAAGLARSQTWASQWLALGASDEDSDSGVAYSQSQPSAYQATAQATLHLHPGVHGPARQPPPATSPLTPIVEVPNTAETPAQDSSAQGLDATSPGMPICFAAADTGAELNGSKPSDGLAALEDVSAAGTTAALQEAEVASGSERLLANRPRTAGGCFQSGALQQWQLDFRRLHSARPGSGGSPTARSALLHPDPKVSLLEHGASQSWLSTCALQQQTNAFQAKPMQHKKH